MNTVPMKPQRITHSEIASVAAEGVARALAAREEHLRELSPGEIDAVGGGALMLKYQGLINGGRAIAALAGLGGLATNPAADLGGLSAGFGMV